MSLLYKLTKVLLQSSGGQQALHEAQGQRISTEPDDKVLDTVLAVLKGNSISGGKMAENKPNGLGARAIVNIYLHRGEFKKPATKAFRELLATYRGNMSHLSVDLDYDRRHLYRKLEELGINPPEIQTYR